MGRGMLEHERALAQIIENKRRKRDGEPPHPDGERAEVPKIRIHGFTAGHDEHQRTKGYEDAICFRFPQKGDGVSGMKALRISGWDWICHTPSTARTINQMMRTGPKIGPTPTSLCAARRRTARE